MPGRRDDARRQTECFLEVSPPKRPNVLNLFISGSKLSVTLSSVLWEKARFLASVFESPQGMGRSFWTLRLTSRKTLLY